MIYKFYLGYCLDVAELCYLAYLLIHPMLYHAFREERREMISFEIILLCKFWLFIFPSHSFLFLSIDGPSHYDLYILTPLPFSSLPLFFEHIYMLLRLLFVMEILQKRKLALPIWLTFRLCALIQQ